ncbi:MAG: metallophosphoesterase family protein [Anaerolineae bacterium]
MKLGVISDIHADLSALTAALYILRREGVDRIVCAGDLVERGPYGDEVIELIRRGSIPCVQGNHDRDAIDNQRWLRENAIPDHPGLLNAESLAFLGQLPRVLHLELTGQRLTVAHGAPWSPDVYLMPGAPRWLYEQALAEAETDILIVGHTHIPLQVSIGDGLVLNPGSVCGVYTSGSRTCAILTLPGHKWQVFGLSDGHPVGCRVRSL